MEVFYSNLYHFYYWSIGLAENLVDVIAIVGAKNPSYFKKQKDALLEMSGQHQNTSLDYIYEVIQYGENAMVKKSLNERMNNKDFQSYVESLVIEEPGVALLDAVREAKVSFEKFGRPRARKVLVVFSDEAIVKDPVPLSEFQELGEKLRENGVKMIGVTIEDVKGDLDDTIKELTGKDPLKIDSVDDDNTPQRIGTKIAEKTVNG